MAESFGQSGCPLIPVFFISKNSFPFITQWKRFLIVLQHIYTDFYKKIPIFIKKLLDKKIKNGSHYNIMNVHHITKSLFVGAAIAGIGMSSGRAELTIPQSLRNEIRHVVERRLEECYRQVRNVIRDDGDYSWEDYRKDDTNLICDLITNERRGFFYFCSLEMMDKPYSFSTLKRDLRYFFEEQCPPYERRVQFSNEMIKRSALLLNRIIRSVIGEGDPFGLFRAHRKSRILAQKGIVDEDKYGFYFKHSFVFNDEFIETIAGIIHNGMTIVNKMYEITTVEGVKRLENPVVNNVLKMYLEGVQQLYCRYLVIENSPRDINTIDACNKFIMETEKLAMYDRRIASFCPKNYKCTADWLCSQDEEAYMNGVLLNAVVEIGKLKKAVEYIRDEGNFTDPVYWAPAPVSDEEGADILKELEEQEDNHPAFVVYEDAPNAFLEQID